MLSLGCTNSKQEFTRQKINFNGKALAIVAGIGQSGSAIIHVSADGLNSDSLKININ